MDISINKDNPFDKVNPILLNKGKNHDDIYQKFKKMIENINDKKTLIDIQKMIEIKIKSM
tara:strand:+ start:382 stop:561 length:180 start_codon:yes stop_codon:yes gene_type:complete